MQSENPGEIKEKFKLSLGSEAPSPPQAEPFSLMTIDQIEIEIKARAGIITENIITIGKMLTDVKCRLEHGQFLNWLRDKVNFSQSTANNFMRIAREIPKTPSLVALPYTKALALLDVPETEREQFAQDVNADDKSTRQIQQLIKEKAESEKARLEAETLAKVTAEQLETQKKIAERQQSLSEQYSQQYYNENERANLLEAQLEATKNAQIEPVEVEVPPPDYEQIKAQVAKEKQRAEEAEEYAMQQEAEKQRIQSELRKLRETRADTPFQGDSPLSIDSFSSTIKEFMGKLGMIPNMAPFFRAMNNDTLHAYGQWLNVLSDWLEGTKRAIAEGTHFVDVTESDVV